MGRTSISDIRGVGDPLQQWNWDLFIPNMPGTSNSRPFTFKCQTTSIPGFQIEPVLVGLHGVELSYAGRALYTKTFDCTLLESRDGNTRDMFTKWKELARSWKLNTGTSKDIYATNGELVLYDDTPSVIRTIKIYGMWPSNLADSQLDGQASQAVTHSVTFTYDWVDDSAA